MQYPGDFWHISFETPDIIIKYLTKCLYIDNPLPFFHFPENWWINTGLYQFNNIPFSDFGFAEKGCDKVLLNHSLNLKSSNCLLS